MARRQNIFKRPTMRVATLRCLIATHGVAVWTVEAHAAHNKISLTLARKEHKKALAS